MPWSRPNVDDLVDVVVHRLLHPRRGRDPWRGLDRFEAHRQQRRAPSAVAAAGAEADRVALDHRHPQRRVALQQMPRRPQAGEPGADDRHVDIDVAGQRPERRALVVGNRVGPQRAGRATVGIASTLCAVGRPTGRRATDAHRPRMTHLPPPTTAPAGWYPDPTSGGRMRYFDGRAWAPVRSACSRSAKRTRQLPMAAAIGALGDPRGLALDRPALVDAAGRVRLAGGRLHRAAGARRLRAVGRVGAATCATAGATATASDRRVAVPLERSRLGSADLARRPRRASSCCSGWSILLRHPAQQQRRRRLRSRRRPGVSWWRP